MQQIVLNMAVMPHSWTAVQPLYALPQALDKHMESDDYIGWRSDKRAPPPPLL